MFSFLNYTPKLYVGPLLLNRLGLQMLRLFVLNLGRFKPKNKLSPEAQKIVEILKADGTIVIKRFFSA